MCILRDQRGQVMVETAIAFPIQMLMTLAVMQFCLLAVGKQVVNYAAHAAARAALVGDDPQRAAEIVCSPIAGSNCTGGSATPIFMPGWGNLPKSIQSQLKTTTSVLNPLDDGDKMVSVEVQHEFELILPFISATPFPNWHPIWGKIVKLGPRGVVHKVLTQTVSIPQPWDGDLVGVRGHEIIPDVTSDGSGSP
ncbi:MAG TPA: TadE/TadG family type IV pilus assembly protein [Planctomycetota bacterium]|nr:TadE/TadG family type IV pilus assembly protein [Planctomycetota bacterium]HRR82654.1 TadE/TadG family type IV pilus assembly protein [Planctomycetota bacterium]HRT95422.1 TadE/TadG family type IV pilus assembly protein [Planctomycetota bacterium]